MNKNLQRIFSFFLVCLLAISICASSFALVEGEEAATGGNSEVQDPAHLNDGETGGVEIPTGNTDPSPSPAADSTPTPTATPAPTPETTPVVPAVVTPDIVLPTETPAPTESPSADHTPTPTFAPGETPTPTPDVITITKQPGSENRDAGTSTYFTVNADAYTSVTWHVANSAGAEIANADWAKYNISLHAGDPLRIDVTNITKDVDHFRFYATFFDAGTNRSTTTNAAVLTVKAGANGTTVTPTPAAQTIATPTPTTRPQATATPVPTPVPTPAPTVTPSAITPLPTFTPIPTTAVSSTVQAAAQARTASSGVGPLIAVIGAALVIAAAAVVLILYMNGFIGRRR